MTHPNYVFVLPLVADLACDTVTDGILATPTFTDVIPDLVTVPPTSTVDPSLPPHWIEYERALSDILLESVGNIFPDLSRDHGLCEWIFMGGKDERPYIWAICENYEGIASDISR